MHKRLIYIFFAILFYFFISKNYVIAQFNFVKSDTILVKSKKTDNKNKISENAVKSDVDYSASDSICFDLESKKMLLFGNSKIKYESFDLNASFIEINYGENIVRATGLPDSTGTITGAPFFKDNEQSFESEQMSYNFKTKKGIIKDVITKEGDGYMHGKIIKRLPDEEVNVKNGAYTTCDLHDPHFQIRFNKAKVKPNDKIVTGPAYLEIEDVPTFLALPFGIFPNKKGQNSGILIPSPGESTNKGFFLQNGGYYFGISDYVDLELRGDYYTRGSWGTRAKSNYKKRYKYFGNFELNYANNIIGEKDLPDYISSKDFRIIWFHSQDPKARPNSTFSANVNIGSSTYNKYNSLSSKDYLENTMSSSISYQTLISNKYNLTLALRHNQSTLTKRVSLALPELSFSTGYYYPFRSTKVEGNKKWYDDITISYNMSGANRLETADSMLFKSETKSKFQNGIQHSVPVSSTVKVLKYFNLSNSINFNEKLYFKNITKSWTNDSNYIRINKLGYSHERIDTTREFRAVNEFYFTSALSTKLYGMMMFKNNKIKAVRHVFTPTVSFTLRPDFGSKFWGYYKSYYDSTLKRNIRYSIFEREIYGSPTDGKSGTIGFNFGNNLEMKYNSKTDTGFVSKKISLLESFSLAFSYDLAKDSLNWSDISLNGRTRLFDFLDVSYSSIFNPYLVDSNKFKINKLHIKEDGKLARLSNTNWIFGLNFRLSPETFKKKDTKKVTEAENTTNKKPSNGLDYKIPWNLSLSYNLNIANTRDPLSYKRDQKVIQTMNFNGEINLTPKWKVGFSSGYDFKVKDLTYTSVNIYRDLHCWEILFSWIPIGFMKSYSFTLRVKSSVLQDLKLEKKQTPSYGQYY